MTSSQKQKGHGYERELVTYFKANGLEAKRAWGSNGQSLGEHEEVDIIVYKENIPIYSGMGAAQINSEGGHRNLRTLKNYAPLLKLQSKRIKALPKWLGLTEHVDAVVTREDNGESYIIFRLCDFTNRFLK